MGIVCQQCGDKGFEHAYVYCINCLNFAVHRYCLPTIPETLDEFVSWVCVDCNPELDSGSHLKNQVYSPCSVSQSSEEETSPSLIKRPQSPFRSPPLGICSERTTEKGNSCPIAWPSKEGYESNFCLEVASEPQKNLDFTGRAESPLRKIELKKNGMTCTAAETSIINVDLSEYALKHDSSPLVEVSKKIKKNASTSSEAETADERCESSRLHGRHKNLDSTDCANLGRDLSTVIELRDKYISSTMAGIDEQKCRRIPSQSENRNVGDHGTDLKDGRLIPKERSKVVEEAVDIRVANCQEAHVRDHEEAVFSHNYHPPAPAIVDEIWRGSFSISYKSYGLDDGVVGHLSSKACPKVAEEAGLLPSSLCLEMLPKITVWPKSFETSQPSDHIGLYFFPRTERFRKSFDLLVEDMMRRELAMRAVVKNAELLVFTSSELPLQYWKFQENYFLWGVFRAKQSASPEDHHLVLQNHKTGSPAHLSLANEVGIDSESCSSIKTIKILNDSSPISPLNYAYISGLAQMNPDFYYGKEDSTELENWIRDFEKILDAVNCPANQRVTVAEYYFKGEAGNWWSATKTALLAQADFNWESLKMALRARFYPQHIKSQKYWEFLALKQRDGSVTEYHRKFVELSYFAEDIVPTEASKVRRFIDGLNCSIQKTLAAMTFATLHEAYGKATSVWNILQDKSRKRKAETQGDTPNTQIKNQIQGDEKRLRPNTAVGNQGQNRDNYGNRNTQNRRPKREYHCKRCNKDHPGVDCKGIPVKCNKCGKKGHRAFECRVGKNKNQHGRNGGNKYPRLNQNGNSLRPPGQNGNQFWPNNQYENNRGYFNNNEASPRMTSTTRQPDPRAFTTTMRPMGMETRARMPQSMGTTTHREATIR